MKPFRFLVRPRFSLWAMLVLITVVAIPLAYVAQRRTWNLRRKAAYEELVAKDVSLRPEIFDELAVPPVSPPPASGVMKWWRGMLLDDAAPQVKEVVYGRSKFDKSPFVPLVDDDSRWLAAFPEIERIELQDAEKITDGGIASVVLLPHLRDLKLNHMPSVEGAFLQHVPQPNSLETLHLGRVDRFRAENLRSLSRCASLKTLHFFRIPQLNDESLRGIALPKGVTHLHVRYCAIGDETIERWLDEQELVKVTIDARVTRNIVEALARESGLKQIQLTSPPFTAEDEKVLRSRLKLDLFLLEEALNEN